MFTIFFQDTISLLDISLDDNSEDVYYAIRRSILMEIYNELKRLQELEKFYRIVKENK